MTADTAIHGYFRAKARAEFTAAGGNPDNAGPLAEWAQNAKKQGRARAGVIVAEDGTLLAETVNRDCGHGLNAFYVTPEDTKRYGMTANEVGLAMAHLRGVTGQNVIHVKASHITSGPGFAVRGA